jgi:hypothetical protein
MTISYLVVLTVLCASFSNILAQSAKEATVPEGTKIRLALQTPISSKLNEPGDQLTAILYEPLRIDGNTVLARGTEFQGRITEIKPAASGQKQSSMTIVFDRLSTPYGEEAVSLSLTAIEDYTNDEKYKANGEGKVNGGRGGKNTAENARTGAGIGGALAGIVLLAGGGLGAAAGALGAGLAGGVLLTKGKEIKLQPGTLFRASFNRPIKLPVQSYGPKPQDDGAIKTDKPISANP